MNEGILWFDSDLKRELAGKIKRAADHYQSRFGLRPTLCCLNSIDFGENLTEIEGIRLRAEPSVLRHHLWIGIEN